MPMWPRPVLWAAFLPSKGAHHSDERCCCAMVRGNTPA